MEPQAGFWRGQRVCVTGGTGFLGYHLVCRLLKLGADVTVLALAPRADHPLLLRPVKTVFGDVRDPETVRRAITGCGVVFHTAGLVATWGPALRQMHSVHVTGTEEVLRAAGAARVVHTSSIVAVGAPWGREPVTEDSPFRLDRLRVDYVRAKRAAEQVALEAAARGRHVVVTNPGYLVGPGDYEPSVLGRFCTRFWKGRVPFALAGGLNLVDVRDVADGHLLAAEHGRPGRRYILGGENRTCRSFMAKLADVAGMRPRALPAVPWWSLGPAAGLSELRALWTGKEPFPGFQHLRLNRHYWFCSSARARQELGYRPRDLNTTLDETYRWHAGRAGLAVRGLNRWWMRPVRQAA
jgi:dihydroflavonol-4-reductase